MKHIETVQHIYEAFGTGDVPAILGYLADDVEWEYGRRSTDVPWLKARKGRAAVAGFFEALGALEFEAFDVKEILHHGDTVVALIDLEVRVKQTGRRIVEEDEVHIWRFDPQGRVRRFRHQLDTHQHWAALHDEAPMPTAVEA